MADNNTALVVELGCDLVGRILKLKNLALKFTFKQCTTQGYLWVKASCTKREQLKWEGFWCCCKKLNSIEPRFHGGDQETERLMVILWNLLSETTIANPQPKKIQSFKRLPISLRELLDYLYYNVYELRNELLIKQIWTTSSVPKSPTSDSLKSSTVDDRY